MKHVKKLSYSVVAWATITLLTPTTNSPTKPSKEEVIQKVQRTKKSLRHFLKKYGVSVAAGATIGTISGTLSGVMDLSLSPTLLVPPLACIAYPFEWFVMKSLRNTAEESICETFEDEGIEHSDLTIDLVSFLSCWIAWYRTINTLLF